MGAGITNRLRETWDTPALCSSNCLSRRQWKMQRAGSRRCAKRVWERAAGGAAGGEWRAASGGRGARLRVEKSAQAGVPVLLGAVATLAGSGGTCGGCSKWSPGPYCAGSKPGPVNCWMTVMGRGDLAVGTTK